MGAERMVEVTVPMVGAVQVPESWLWLALLGLASFFSFFVLDPFRIIEKVDHRLVRLYKLPERGSAVRGKRMLCLVNPFSGMRDGRFQFGHVAHRLLKSSGAETEVVVTENSTQLGELGAETARKVLAGQDDALPDGVLVFGGDGSLCEFVNGMVSEATEGSMDLREARAQKVLKRIPVCHMPVGSSNGVAASNGCKTCYEAVVQIIEGDDKLSNTTDFDMTQVTYLEEATGEEKRMVDLHCVSWGIITDHDELAERRWRHLGKSLKAILAPLTVIARRRTYRGKVSFRPAAMEPEELARLTATHGYRDPSGLADAEADELAGWKTIEGEFIMVTASNLSWMAHDVCAAPDVGFDDGSMALLIIRGNASRADLIRAFLSMGTPEGAGLSVPCVELYKVSAVRMEADKAGSMGASGANIQGTRIVTVETIPRVGRYLRRPALVNK